MMLIKRYLRIIPNQLVLFDTVHPNKSVPRGGPPPQLSISNYRKVNQIYIAILDHSDTYCILKPGCND